MLARLCRQLRPAFLDSRCSFSTSAACNDPGGVLARVVREHIDYVKLSGLYKEELSFTGPQSAVVRECRLAAAAARGKHACVGLVI